MIHGFLKIALFMSIVSVNASADEAGVETGLNISNYKSWDTDHAEYQKIDVFNPIGIFYQKEINHFWGIHSSLKYARKSISTKIQKVNISPVGEIETDGYIKFENLRSYVSLGISPQLYYKLKDVVVDLQLGVSGDMFIKEWYDYFDAEIEAESNNNNRELVWSFIGGLGIGYVFTDKIKAGYKTTVSRTVSNVYKKTIVNDEIYYVNFHNTISVSYLF